ncbi:MAG TPA: MerR family transcriptional regulator [Rhizomicrobium sp.]
MSSAAFAYPQKSAEAFRTISEVALELAVPQHVLRFWESRFSQVRPVKRAGGRRYYRPDDVDLLKGIRSLLYIDGLTIKGVQKVLKERGLRHVTEVGRGNAPQPQTLVIERPVVVEKIVYVEKPAPVSAAPPAPAKKARPAHLRSVPAAMSLPFFDSPKAVVEEPPAAAIEPVIEVVEIAAELETGLPDEEREKLDALLDELVALKSRLQAVRGRKV